MTEINPLAICWGLFRLLEAVADDGRDLTDPEVDAFLEAAESEIGTNGLMGGWALVAALLRKYLIDHAVTLGCDCGSADWLRSEQLWLAAR